MSLFYIAEVIPESQNRGNIEMNVDHPTKSANFFAFFLQSYPWDPLHGQRILECTLDTIMSNLSNADAGPPFHFWGMGCLVLSSKYTIDWLSCRSLLLGTIGMPGNSAYFGLLDICQPKVIILVVMMLYLWAVAQTFPNHPQSHHQHYLYYHHRIIIIIIFIIIVARRTVVEAGHYHNHHCYSKHHDHHHDHHKVDQ